MGSQVLAKTEKAIKAIAEIAKVVALWRIGKITHESAMEAIYRITKEAA